MSELYIVQTGKTTINSFRALSDTNRENQLWHSLLASKEAPRCERRVDGSLSKIMSLKNISVETSTFYFKTVDSVILNCDRPLGVTTLILLNKTQDS